MILMLFLLYLLIYGLHKFLNVNTETPGMNPVWSWCTVLFTYCWIWLTNILIFCIFVHEWDGLIIFFSCNTFVGLWHQVMSSKVRTLDFILREETIQCSYMCWYEKIPSPGWCGSEDWVPACKPKGHQFNSQWQYMPELQSRSSVGGMWDATTHWPFSPFVLPPWPSF